MNETKIWLVMRTGSSGQRSFPLRHPRTVIGRETRCDVRIAVPAVAAQHCEIKIDEEGLRVRDLGSVTGTYLNGERVETAALRFSDMLTVGPVTFEVNRRAPAESGRSP